MYGEAVGLRLSLPASCKLLRRGCVLMPAVCGEFLLSPLHGPLTPSLPRRCAQSRVLHGVRPEILALSEIPFVKAYTARLLYRAGLR